MLTTCARFWLVLSILIGLQNSNCSAIDPDRIVALGCDSDRQAVAGQNKFFVLDHGGLSVRPDEPWVRLLAPASSGRSVHGCKASHFNATAPGYGDCLPQFKYLKKFPE